MKFIWLCLGENLQEILSPAGQSLKGNEACDDKSVSVSSSDHMWALGAGVRCLVPIHEIWPFIVSPGFKVSHIWVSVKEWNERGIEAHSLEHSSIIYFFFFWRTTTASHLENSSISNNTVLKNVKLLYKFLIEKKKNKLTAELFFFLFLL